MNLAKYTLISIIYVVAVQGVHGILQHLIMEIASGPNYLALQIFKYVAFIVPIVVIVVKALKINNLYNVRRFTLRAIKKHIIGLVAIALALFFIASNCYVSHNMINIFLSQIDTQNEMILAIGYNIFDDPTTGIFAFLLSVLGMAQMYNKPLTGNER